MNPVLSMLNGKGNPMIAQFLQFANTFKGDPNAFIQDMLKEGKIRQADLDAAVKTAKQLEPLLKPFMK